MKKLLTIALVLMGQLWALPLVNPADSILYTNEVWSNDCFENCWLGNFSLRLGYYGDFVFDRNLQVMHGTGAVPSLGFAFPEGGDIEQTCLTTNAGIVLLNFCDWIQAYGTFGVTTIYARTNSSIFANIAEVFNDLSFSPSVSYTAGAAAPIWNSGCFTLGVQAQYFYTNPEANSLTGYDAATGVVYLTDAQAKYIEYQGAIAASWTFEGGENLAFVPFIGIQFSGVSWNLGSVDSVTIGANVTDFPEVHQQQVVGWTIGTSLILCDLIGVTAEARFANEKALFVNGQLAF